MALLFVYKLDKIRLHNKFQSAQQQQQTNKRNRESYHFKNIEMDSFLLESTRKLSISEKDANLFSIDDEHSDLDVKTGERLIRAHKSVLRQCPYFAAMIDGNWIESQSSSVTLNG